MEFAVRRIVLWKYIRENSPDIPREARTLEDLIKNLFFRYFGITETELDAEEYDFESFETQVGTFRKGIREWRKKTGGYGTEFLKKSFLCDAIVLKKKHTPEFIEVVENSDVGAEATPGPSAEATPPEPRAFDTYKESTKREKTRAIRTSHSKEAISKAFRQNLKEDGHRDAAWVAGELEKDPSTLGNTYYKDHESTVSFITRAHQR